MSDIFISYILTTIVGTILSILLILLRPVTRKFFSYDWHYYIWIAVLLIMIFPIRLNLFDVIVENNIDYNIPTISDISVSSNTPSEIILDQGNISNTDITEDYNINSFIQSIKDTLINRTELLSYIWLIVAFGIFIYKILCYLIFINKLYSKSEAVMLPEIKKYTSRNIKIRRSNKIRTPLITGIFNPVLVLPDIKLTDEQLHYVLKHEIKHLHRNDILYKWVINIVKFVHWFNPMVYVISNQIDTECEVSCDISVIKEIDNHSEIHYIDTILLLLRDNKFKQNPLTSGMTSKKKILRKRFMMIKNRRKISKLARMISIITAIMITLTCFVVSGVFANETLAKLNNKLSTEIEVTHNGYLVILENKPFVDDEIVYLPLRELLEKTGLLSHNNCKIEWNENKIILNLAEGDNLPQYDGNGNIIDSKPVLLRYCYGIEIGKEEYIINPESTSAYDELKPKYQKELNKIIKMQKSPVLKNNTTYIPYEYVESMINKFMQKTKINVRCINDAVRKEIRNAENMSYEDIKNLQISVDNGHFPWRLMPDEVIKSFLSAQGLNVNNIRTTETTKAELRYTDGDIEIVVFKPIDKTEKGIWIVKTYTDNKDTLVWPVDSKSISRSFGKRKHPITGEEKSHNGVDIIAPENSPVFSTISGEVTETGYDNELGNYIIIQNNNDVRVLYGHLSEIEVDVGSKVAKNAIIGKVGKTGTATGVNLHFEIQINGEYSNPEEIFQLDSQNKRLKNIVLFNDVNAKKPIQENQRGYKVKNYMIAEIDFNTKYPGFNGELPSRINAWYKEDGENKRCVGKADAPYTQIPIKLILDFSLQNVKNGELQFEAEYKNGIKEMSEIIKIYK